MSDPVILQPGRAGLTDWRAIYQGRRVELDPICRADVEAGASALNLILEETDASPAEPVPPPATETRSNNSEGETETGAPLAEGAARDDPLPANIVRLVLALKLASLGQGASGIGWSAMRLLAECLRQNLLPVIASRDSSGGSADSVSLAQFAAALCGEGEINGKDDAKGVGNALRDAGLAILEPGSRDAAILASGTQVSTALALAGLFEAERLFQSALVIGGLSAAAVNGSIAGLDPRLQRLRRHSSQIEIAGCLRALLDGASGTVGATEDILTRQPEHLGICLDLLRQAGQILAAEANAVSEDRLVLWQSGELVANAGPGTAQIALAAELIATALLWLGSVSERRLEVVTTARSEQERPAGPDLVNIAIRIGDADGADLEMTRRLLPIAGKTTLTLVRELLEAAGHHQAGALPPVLEQVRLRLDEQSSAFGPAGSAASALVGAAEFIRSGELAAIAGVELPTAERKRQGLSVGAIQRCAAIHDDIRREPVRPEPLPESLQAPG